jgi:hypothetical protein
MWPTTSPLASIPTGSVQHVDPVGEVCVRLLESGHVWAIYEYTPLTNLMTQHAQIAERKYCRPHARPFASARAQEVHRSFLTIPRGRSPAVAPLRPGQCWPRPSTRLMRLVSFTVTDERPSLTQPRPVFAEIADVPNGVVRFAISSEMFTVI